MSDSDMAGWRRLLAFWQQEAKIATDENDAERARMYSSAILAAQAMFPELRRRSMRDVWPPGGRTEQVNG